MCWSYKIDPNKRIVTTCASGRLSARDVLTFRDHISMDADFDPGLCLLLDFSKVKKVEILPEEIRILATMNPFSATTRRAFVMADHYPSVGLLGALELFNATRRFYGEQTTQLFTSQKAALEWLCSKAKSTRRMNTGNSCARKSQGRRPKPRVSLPKPVVHKRSRNLLSSR